MRLALDKYSFYSFISLRRCTIICNHHQQSENTRHYYSLFTPPAHARLSHSLDTVSNLQLLSRNYTVNRKKYTKMFLSYLKQNAVDSDEGLYALS